MERVRLDLRPRREMRNLPSLAAREPQLLLCEILARVFQL